MGEKKEFKSTTEKYLADSKLLKMEFMLQELNGSNCILVFKN